MPRAIDLGLAVLSACQKDGETFTCDQIGAACGITDVSIFLIERKALRKVRHRLRYSKDAAALRELFR